MTMARVVSSWSLLLAAALIAGVLGVGINGAVDHEKELQQALSRARQWQEIVQHSDTAFIVCDVDGKIVQWSEGATVLFGWRETEAVGADLSILIPPGRYAIHEDGFRKTETRDKLENGEVLQVVGYMIDRCGNVLEVHVRVVAVVNGRTLYVAQVVFADKVTEVPPMAPLDVEEVPPPAIPAARDDSHAQ